MVIDRTLTDANNDRAARISQPRNDAAITVFFGWNDRGELRLAPGRSSRCYRTEKLAEKAARAWVNA